MKKFHNDDFGALIQIPPRELLKKFPWKPSKLFEGAFCEPNPKVLIQLFQKLAGPLGSRAFGRSPKVEGVKGAKPLSPSADGEISYTRFFLPSFFFALLLPKKKRLTAQGKLLHHSRKTSGLFGSQELRELSAKPTEGSIS